MKIDVAYGRDLDDHTLQQLLYMEADALACYNSIDAEKDTFVIGVIPTETVKQFKRRMGNTLFFMKTMQSLFEKKKILVGMACLSKKSKKLQYLHTVYVANNHRRKGIGEALVRRALKEAKKTGSSVSLGVNPLNDKAICLYKKLGFKFSRGQTIVMETN